MCCALGVSGNLGTNAQRRFSSQSIKKRSYEQRVHKYPVFEIQNVRSSVFKFIIMHTLEEIKNVK